MFKRLFDPEGGLMITMTQLTDCIFLSLFFILGCVGIVTVGSSFAALYDSVWQAFRKGNKRSWSRFLQTFRENWKAGIGPTLVFLALAAGLGWGLIQLWNGAVAGTVGWMVFSGAAFLGVLVLGILSILFPMLSRFQNSFGVLLKNTLLLGLARLPLTLVLGILNAAAFILCFRFIFPLLFLPALTALISTLLIEPMFKPYM